MNFIHATAADSNPSSEMSSMRKAAPNNHSFGDDVSRSDLRHFLHRRLNVLPRHQREALELAFFAGISHREIAAVTRAPLGTVKTRLELGLQKLTQSLRPLRHKS